MTIARIDGGAVVETRAALTLDQVPAHKRAAWRTVVDQPPTYEPRLESAVATGWDITETTATRTYQVARQPLAMQMAAVKAEAQRRIIAIAGASDLMSCLTKQLNAQMRAAELINIKAEGGTLTAEQEAEAAALQALADAIKAIRAASNVIEAMDPIPADFAADARWS